MSTVLGRWPLIPSHNCTVSLPNSIIGTTSSDVNAPNIFCERILQIELAKIAFDLLTSNNGKPSADPVVIKNHIKRLNEEFLDRLPPAFRLHGPDEQWDDDLPNLKRQREMFRISVSAVMCMLLRPIIIMSASQARTLSSSDRNLLAEHRTSLFDAAVEMLESVERLHMLMGGKHNRFFLLSFFTFEPAALLGMHLSTQNFSKTEGEQRLSALLAIGENAMAAQDRWKLGWKKMKEAVARLEMLSEVSSIAKTGLKVLKKLMTKMDLVETAKLLNGAKEGEYAHATSNVGSWRSPTSSVGALHTQTIIHSKTLPVSCIPSLLDAVTVEETLNIPITPPYSKYSDLSQDSPMRKKGWDSTTGLDMPSTTYYPVDGDLSHGDGFLSNDFGSLNGLFGSLDNISSEYMTSTINADPAENAHNYATAYANMNWPSYTPSMAWQELAGSTNPMQHTGLEHANTENHAYTTMDRELDWGSMCNGQVMDLGQ